MILIVDSFAWIEFLAGSPHGDRVHELLSTAEVVITPDLVLAEIARKLRRDGVASGTARRKIQDISTLSRVAPISVEVALGVFDADADLRDSARARRLGSPGISDAIILSMARAFDGSILTGDPHFHGFTETLWLGA